MDSAEKVLNAMKEAGKPLSAGKIATLCKLEKKEVEKAMNSLKKEEKIVSPIRCKWEPR